MGHSNPLEWASTFLGFMAILFIIPIYVFYWNGPRIREKSKFAQVLASDRKKAQRSVSQCGSGEPGPEEQYWSGSDRVWYTKCHIHGLPDSPAMTPFNIQHQSHRECESEGNHSNHLLTSCTFPPNWYTVAFAFWLIIYMHTHICTLTSCNINLYN